MSEYPETQKGKAECDKSEEETGDVKQGNGNRWRQSGLRWRKFSVVNAAKRSSAEEAKLLIHTLQLLMTRG